MYDSLNSREREMKEKYSAAAVACLAAVIAVWGNQATAQTWKPTRPVAMVVGAAPGGSIDLTARLLQRTWDQQKLVPTPVVTKRWRPFSTTWPAA